MKHTRARILSILAAAALTVCSLPQSMPLLHSHAITGITADVANPASEFETVQIGDTVRITGWNGSGNAVVLPAKIDGLPVTAIGDNAFSGNKTLTKVSIPNCITAIGRNAFANCGKLEIIHIPASITEIGSGAFAQTAWLAAKRAENPLVTVNTVLVDGSMCEGWVKVPGGITTIADRAFYGNQSVDAVTLPDTVSVIGDSAFEACTMLESIDLPDQLTSIGDHAFERCTKLQRLDIGENVLTIGEDAFKNCAELTVVYYNNPYAARYMEENNIDTAPLERSVILFGSSPYPGGRIPVIVDWANTGSDIYMLRLFHSPALKPVYSEKKPDQILYITSYTHYEGSSPYNPEVYAIDILNPRVSTYYFDIPQDTKPGVYPLILQIITPDIKDDETQHIEFEIEVLSNLRGDADGDGIISKADAEAIEQYLSSENQEGLTEQGESNADVDNDGMITAADASAILHYLEKGYFPDEEPAQTGTTTTPVTTTTSAAHTVTTTTTAVPCAEIILVPPTKTRYTVGEPLDFSDMSCKVFFTGYTPEGDLSVICQEVPLFFDLPAIIEMGNITEFSEPIQGVLNNVNVTFSGLNIATDTPGVHTVKVTVTTEDGKTVLAEKSFNVTVKPEETEPVTTSTIVKATTTTAKATTTTAKATTTTAKATTTTAKATTTTAKATTTTAKATTTTAKATTTTAKATTTTSKATTTTAKATTTTAKATATTTKATTTTAKATTTTAKATTTAAPVTTTIPTETTPVVTTSAAPAPLRGDINDDGEVSVDDAQLALKAYTNRIAGNDMGLTERQIQAANVNGDGELSVDDAQNILKYYTQKTVAGKDITWEDILGKKAQSLPRLIKKRILSFCKN